MDINHDNTIYGAHKGLWIGQFDRLDELNQRLVERQFPDRDLEPNYDPRPRATRQTLFETHTNLSHPFYAEKVAVEPWLQSGSNRLSTFAPNISRGSVKGYNVDIETDLRGTVHKLTAGKNEQYVPSSTSDLYNTIVESKYVAQPFPRLFERPVIENRQHENLVGTDIGRDRFHNNTRMQLRK